MLIAVDLQDQPVRLVEKYAAHLEGILHRAFSIFIFRVSGASFELLLQKRERSKYHSGGLWTNTCCGHAEAGVLLETSAVKRLQEEMGFSCPLFEVSSFYYKADVGKGLIEHEIDHVFIAIHNPPSITINPKEVEEYKWCLIEEIDVSNGFTAWFPEAFAIAKAYVQKEAL